MFVNRKNINETKADETQVTRFTPVSPYETEAAVETICFGYERALALEAVDPLILIPVFICDFLCIHPFNDEKNSIGQMNIISKILSKMKLKNSIFFNFKFY